MSEAEPIPPTSSVTALRIPMIKKVIHQWRDKAKTTDPAVPSGQHQKLHVAWPKERQEINNEKALNILLSAIPDRHLLSFHDATNAKTLWTAIKARFRGSTFKQSTVEPAHIPKGYTQATSSKENRANGHQEKRIVAIEDSNSKALVATDNNEDIDWTKEFDAEPVTFAMMALTEVEQDDWSMKFDAEHVHLDIEWTVAISPTTVDVGRRSAGSSYYKPLRDEKLQDLDTTSMSYIKSVTNGDSRDISYVMNFNVDHRFNSGESKRKSGLIRCMILNLQLPSNELHSCEEKKTMLIQGGQELLISNILLTKNVPLTSDEQALHDELVNLMHQESLAKLHNDAQRNAFEEEKRRIALEKGKDSVNSTFTLSTANTPSQSTGNTPTDSDDDVPKDGVFSTNSFDDENTDTEEGGAADYNNMDPTIDVTSTPTLRIHKIHPQSQIIGKSTAGILTRRKLKESASDQHQALLSFIYKQNRTNHKDQQTCLFACFLSQEEPKKVSQALADESWVEAMQEELLQFKLQDVWVLCDLPDGKRVIGTKWVFRNKRDERGTIIKNKARLVAQGYRQEEGVDYDEVFAPVARIEAIRLFLAFASFMGFTVYQMDVKSAFLYGNITRRSVCQTSSSLKSCHIQTKSTRVSQSTLMAYIKPPRAKIERYHVGTVKQTSAGIFLSQDKYVQDILNKFDFRTIKPASTPIEAHKSLGKDEEGEEVDVHLYRSMIGCLMYLTASRPDIMFAVCLCARFQVTPKIRRSNLSGGVNILEEDMVFLAMQETKRLWLIIIYRGRICKQLQVVVAQNPVFHSKTKHIQIRHHFIRDCYEQRLINVVKVHTDDNVADLLTKGFDLARFKFLVVTIGMMNP
ncbi:putative ribonuclease H-like domain-containing protein [Tanacetum coccineum]